MAYIDDCIAKYVYQILHTNRDLLVRLVKRCIVCVALDSESLDLFVAEGNLVVRGFNLILQLRHSRFVMAQLVQFSLSHVNCNSVLAKTHL